MRKHIFNTYVLFLQSTDKIVDDHVKVKYKFLSPDKNILFSGDDFNCPMGHNPESKWSAVQLLGFLTLKPGDTDSEYFDNYTPAQLDFCNSSDCENLSLIVYDYENKGIL